MTWIPLQVHSQYSILDATASIKDLVSKAKEHGITALALTDHGNLFGAVEFYRKCMENDIKPIIGCEFYVAPKSRLDKTKEMGSKVAHQMTLIAKNEEGYNNLVKLSSMGYLEGFYYFPRIDYDCLMKHSKGLVCLCGGLSSLLAQNVLQEKMTEFNEEILKLKKIFKDDFYLQLNRFNMEPSSIENDGMTAESWLVQNYEEAIQKQDKVNLALVNASKELSVPYVATNDIHYLNREDWKAHEILINIQSGEPCEIWEKDSLGNLKQKRPNPKRRTYFSHELYFKSPQQMEELFKDLPDAIANTQLVAEKCHFSIDFDIKHYPVFVPPFMENKPFSEKERMQASEQFLKDLCYQNIPTRYDADKLKKIEELYPNKKPLELINQRLEMELEVILSKGMGDYLLIVYDFIDWAKKNGIPVGPGRGSGAGSIILYLIGITDIEPLRFFLFFERFINPERSSYPDIDVDICMDKRGLVIDYTLQKYGKANVAQIITFGTMKAKMAIKDVGRVLNVPLSKVNLIAKLIPEELNITIDRALDIDPDLNNQYNQDSETKRVLDMARILEGCVRNTGVHAAGVVISGDPLVEHIPVCLAKDSELAVTQFSMKPLESVGMLKMDFLGLKTLTCIQKAVEMIEETSQLKIDWTDLPLDDAKAFELLRQGKTLGIFQLESAGMADLAQKLRMDKFEEIIAAIALYRPGPMSMIPSFINRKHGKESIEIDHPWMEEILKETYGVMVYQEQVMQIASKLANYSLGEGDVLRRAMGKKDAKQMAEQREKFKDGAKANGINEETATLIFDKMEKFAAYGFNKSHAAAYAYLSYVTCYLKANYSKEWMAALMTCDSDDVGKVAKFIQECKNLNIEILPPDVNEAGKQFRPTQEGIRFAMNAIKGVGDGVVETIINERAKKGPFESLYQFFQRIDLKHAGKKNLEVLALAGCFDFCGWSRDEIVLSIEPMYDAALLDQKEQAKGIISFFSLIPSESKERFSTPPKVTSPRTKLDQLFLEKELLGFFLTQHPLESYKSQIKTLSCIPLKSLGDMEVGAVFRTSFIIEDVKTRIAMASQKKFAILMISDGVERFELPVWNDLYEKTQHLICNNQLLCAVLRVDERDGVRRLHCHWLEDLNKEIKQLVHECDQAYDQTKLLIERRKRAKERKMASPTPKKMVLSLKLKVDIDQIHLSQILKLKKHFRTFPGDSPIKISFCEQNKVIANLQIESNWGVEINQTLSRLILSVSDAIQIVEGT
ncbi:MAG: DNA polymerase III subunit alpha [Chlamydiae bacterium]|nr:DNA polymerase III subunit alpha [Chlamydiota bacterium]